MGDGAVLSPEVTRNTAKAILIMEDMMNNESIISLAKKYISNSPDNYISEENAINHNCVGLKIYDSPIFAFGLPDDELYNKYSSADVIGSNFMAPDEWLTNVKTVISFFLPYTEHIKNSNAIKSSWPADEWLHGRYEGQILLTKLSEYLVKTILEAGYMTIAPSVDQRYKTYKSGNTISNWSERHIAFACGLGTFGLSRGLITEKGVSGRFGSILTELDLPKDSRAYKDVYEYCNMCGDCIKRCPVKAISLENKMNQMTCGRFLDKIREKHSPRYGCGKCQTGVQCESRIPAKSKLFN
jgi:epoxyqueuosine reductase QueG